MMAKYAPLDDGSYLVDTDGRPVRTMADPVDYGYESDPDYAPKPPTAEERLARVAGSLDMMRRETDPEYRALAEEQDRRKAYEEQETRTRQIGEGLRREEEEAPPHLQPTARLDDFGGEESRPTSRADFDLGGGASDKYASLPAPKKAVPEGTWEESGDKKPEEKPRNLQRSLPASATAAAEPAAPTGDPTRKALSDLALRNVVRRSGPSKGGFSPVGVTTTREGVPDPAALAGVEQAARTVDQIGDEQIEARAQALRDKVITPQLTALESDAKSLRASYIERKRTDEELAKLQKIADDKERAADEMPRLNARDDYWADKGMFARVLAALAAGAFQFGQGLAGHSGPNIPMQMTEAAIAENADVLRAEHEDAQAAGKKARNAYSEALATYGDRESAMKALRLEGQALTDRMKSIQLAQHGSDQERSDWELQKAQRREGRAREYADLSAKAAGSTVSSERYAPASPGGTSIDPKMIDLYMKLNPDAQGDTPESKLRRETISDERAVRLPSNIASRVGQPAAFAKDKEQADRASEALRTTDLGVAAIDNMEKILERGGGSVLADDREDMETQIGVISATLANPLAFRQQTGPEMEITRTLGGESALNLVTKLGGPERAKVAIKRAKELFKRNENLWLRELKNQVGPRGQYIVPNVNEEPSGR